MARNSRLIAAALVASVAMMAACGSGNDDADDDGATPSAVETAQRTAQVTANAAGGTPSAGVTEIAPTAVGDTPVPGVTTAAPTVASSGGTSGGTAPPPPPPPPPPPAPAPAGRTYTAGEAQAIVQSAPLVASDAGAGWVVLSDAVTDNATAAAADPVAGASFARCGRLLGRTLVLQPAADQLATRYLAGQSVSFFTNMTVYATDAGAIDCANEAASRFGSCADLARAFGTLFVDPGQVTCAPVNFAQVGDGSIAGTLTGKVAAAGVEVDLTVLAVAFRKGNVGVIVGSAAAGAPSTSELAPLVDRVIGRIGVAQ